MTTNQISIAALGTVIISAMLATKSADMDGKILNKKTSPVFFTITLVSIGIFYWSIFMQSKKS